ncbi:hypothetical protein CapIbe_016370 [Capra ibex]
MDPPTAGAQALGAAEQPRGLQLPSGREEPPSPGADHSNQERAPENATDRLANGAQSIPHDSPAHGEGTHCEEEGFAEDDEDSDGEPSPWELSEGMSGCLPKEQAGDLFHEDWDLELKADQGNPYDADDIQGCLSQEDDWNMEKEKKQNNPQQPNTLAVAHVDSACQFSQSRFPTQITDCWIWRTPCVCVHTWFSGAPALSEREKFPQEAYSHFLPLQVF